MLFELPWLAARLSIHMPWKRGNQNGKQNLLDQVKFKSAH